MLREGPKQPTCFSCKSLLPSENIEQVNQEDLTRIFVCGCHLLVLCRILVEETLLEWV